ncbi:MAG TPA: glycosyltransferase family 39 protein [Mucilaginibacter sp.]|nr:glycosyltransferase family 39 protein [Mucilaginibacter sp.]
MPLSATDTAPRSNKPILYFLLCWTALNLLQAYVQEIHADEAYYWLYSRFLDWGYFDHPPMVAIFIRIGDSLVHSEFGVRIMTVLSSTLSLYVLWLIVKKYGVQAKWFILVVAGIFIFHLYGFMTTPDAPLFLFTVLFYFVYQRYAEDDKFKWALLLAVIIACLLYSKYHGILLVGFTLLANLKLLGRKSFWLIVVVSVILFIPHILWQVSHGYPSVNYHLFEQSTAHYSFSQTWTYFPGQLLMAGPLIGWFLFYKAFSVKVKDAFIRCLLVNGIGTFVFFLVSSAHGEVQPQWTLIAFAPLAMLTLIHFKQEGKERIWFARLAWINIVFIVFVRVSIIAGLPPISLVGQVKSQYGFKRWAQAVREKAGNNYVIMDEGFQNPSKYDFYTNSTKGFDYDSKYYRLTQFDIWPIEDSMQRKKAYFLTKHPVNGISADTLNTAAGKWYGGWVNDVRTYQKVKIETDQTDRHTAAGKEVTFNLQIANPYPFAISFSNRGYEHHVALEACTFKDGAEIAVQASDDDFHRIELQPGQKANYTFKFAAPAQRGKYTVLFSLRTDPFSGSKNSRIINLTVE